MEDPYYGREFYPDGGYYGAPEGYFKREEDFNDEAEWLMEEEEDPEEQEALADFAVIDDDMDNDADYDYEF